MKVSKYLLLNFCAFLSWAGDWFMDQIWATLIYRTKPFVCLYHILSPFSWVRILWSIHFSKQKERWNFFICFLPYSFIHSTDIYWAPAVRLALSQVWGCHSGQAQPSPHPPGALSLRKEQMLSPWTVMRAIEKTGCSGGSNQGADSGHGKPFWGSNI